LVTLNGHDNVLQDGQHPSTVWTRDVTPSALANSRDRGPVSCFVDPETELHVILVARIGKSGTEAATDFLTNETGLDAWFKTVHPRSGANVEVVVSTDLIEGEHGLPHVVACSLWQIVGIEAFGSSGSLGQLDSVIAPGRIRLFRCDWRQIGLRSRLILAGLLTRPVSGLAF